MILSQSMAYQVSSTPLVESVAAYKRLIFFHLERDLLVRIVLSSDWMRAYTTNETFEDHTAKTPPVHRIRVFTSADYFWCLTTHQFRLQNDTGEFIAYQILGRPAKRISPIHDNFRLPIPSWSNTARTCPCPIWCFRLAREIWHKKRRWFSSISEILRQSKISQDGVTFLIDQDILRLEVSNDDPVSMPVGVSA